MVRWYFMKFGYLLTHVFNEYKIFGNDWNMNVEPLIVVNDHF